ncbi:MAG: 3-oxoacyl-[acyl-carrier-protein] synthase III C-terminal domain-containing protein [Bdellovibrionota bacterium]
MPSISSVQTSSPSIQVSKDQMLNIAEHWLQDDDEAKERLLRIIKGSGVENRKFTLPHETLLSLNGMSGRSKYFETQGTQHLGKVISDTLEIEKLSPAEISTLIFTSCSVPSIPSIDAKAITEGRLPSNISRVPIYQHGCAGGVVSLALGAKMASLGKPVIISSVELCSLVFQPGSHEGTQLVAAAIFADGAAAAVISPGEGEVNIVGSQSLLLEESRHLMGYDIFDDGFYLRLDRGLPTALANQAPTIVTEFLLKYELKKADINFWLFHPGGVKILDFLAKAFELNHAQCRWSYEILRDNGNMSSATILFVLQKFLAEQSLKPGERALVMGIGPGLTVELVLLEGR